MSPEPPGRDALADRRALLEYVLKDFARRGGQLQTPAGYHFQDTFLLDNLDVGALVRQLPMTSMPIDLGALSAAGRQSAAANGVTAGNDNPFLNGASGAVAGGRPPSVLRPGQNGKAGASGGVDVIPTYTFKPSGGLGAGSNPFVTAPAAERTASNPFLAPAAPTPVPLPASSPRPLPPALPAPQKGGTSGGGAADDDSVSEVESAPDLALPMLETGVPAPELHELAYLLFCAACPPTTGGGVAIAARPARPGGPQPGDGLRAHHALRLQLGLDEAQARDAASVLRHVMSGRWTAARRCSLEGLVTMLAAARPEDFNLLGGGGKGFKAWSRWRSGAGAVVAAAAELRHTALQRSPDSRKLLARLRGALRRLDVRTPDEFEEEEYAEGAAALKDAARGLAFCTLKPPPRSGAGAHPSQGGLGGEWASFENAPVGGGGRRPSSGSSGRPSPTATQLGRVGSGAGSDATGQGSAGWQLPWALRAGVAEVILSALFEPGPDAAYIDEVVAVQGALDSSVWPALGVSPTLALSLSAWTHFRQYLRTGKPWLARQLKSYISKLSAVVVPQRLQRSASLAASGSFKAALGLQAPEPNSPLTADDEAEADSAVAAEVGRLIVERLVDRLSDYHAAFPPGQEQAFQVMLDTTASAARARGDSDAAVTTLLLGIVGGSAGAAWQRAYNRAAKAATSAESGLLAALGSAADVAAEESARFEALLAPHLPGAKAAVSARLHKAAGDQLLPWLRSGLSLSRECLEVVRMAMDVDEHLGGAVQEAQKRLALEAPTASTAAAAGLSGADARSAAAVVAGALRGFLRWELDIPIQKAQEQWVAQRGAALATWVDRQLTTEKWTPVSTRDGFSQSSVEVAALIQETVEALLSMGLPVHAAPLAALLRSADAALHRYASYILGLVSNPSRLIPATPVPTRYKKPFVAEQELIEARLLAATTPGLQAVAAKKGAMEALREIGRSMINTQPKGLKHSSMLRTPSEKALPGSAEEQGFLVSVPPIQSHPEFNALKTHTPVAMACYIMSAHQLAHEADRVVAVVQERWRPPPSEQQSDTSWLPGTFQPSKRQLKATVEASCVFLATKVVFWDMRYGWLEQLYRHHVPSRVGSAAMPPYSCRIEPLLHELNQVLSQACGSLPDDLRSLLATELLTAAATAWQRVLLDGGPCRWFIPADAPVLQDDLESLQALFEADGEGLPRNVTEPVMRPCRRLLLLVGCELSQLISLVRTARLHGKATLQAHGQAPEVFEEYVLVRALARRPERMGSKLLKKDYKMSRRVKA